MNIFSAEGGSGGNDGDACTLDDGKLIDGNGGLGAIVGKDNDLIDSSNGGSVGKDYSGATKVEKNNLKEDDKFDIKIGQSGQGRRGGNGYIKGKPGPAAAGKDGIVILAPLSI